MSLRICTPGQLSGGNGTGTVRAHTRKCCSSILHSPTLFLTLWDKERYSVTALWQVFPNSVTTHREPSIIPGQKGQKLLSTPYQVLIATRMPEAMQALTGSLGLTWLLLKSMEHPRVNNSVSSYDRKWFPVPRKTQEACGKEKNANSIVTASGDPPNQIEKKTKEIFWLLSIHSCIPRWNRWIFLILPSF